LPGRYTSALERETSAQVPSGIERDFSFMKLEIDEASFVRGKTEDMRRKRGNVSLSILLRGGPFL